MGLSMRTSEIYTIVVLWGLYQYNSLPMVIVVATDVFQARLSGKLSRLPYVLVYIYDIAIISNGTFTDHLQKVETVLSILLETGLQVKSLKCLWAKVEVEYLGFVLTKEDIKPQHRKIKHTMAITSLKTKEQLRRFIGMIKYYKDMFSQRAHIMQPFISIVGKASQ